MNRQDEKKVIKEIIRIKDQRGIDFGQMPESELSRWVGYLVNKIKAAGH